MKTTESGRQAEQAAALYLEARGYSILARNWRNKWCEIDLVTERAGDLRIVEVKYRQHRSFGGGFGAITPDKLRRLRRAALAFSRGDQTVIIDVVAVSGRPGEWQIELLQNAIGIN